MNRTEIAYFAGEPLGVPVLEKLLEADIKPSLVVCSPDRPSGRGQRISSPPVKQLADAHSIPVFQPERIKIPADVSEISNRTWDLFVVVAYHKILPSWLIELPVHRSLNVHPSLLPQLRGPSPIRTAILEDRPEAVGVSIMLMDQKMDQGPLLAQAPLPLDPAAWPLPGRELDAALADLGGELLATTLPRWLSGELAPREQDHAAATYTKKITRHMGELEIDIERLPRGEAARQALLKIRAFDGWPGTYFFHHGRRVKITKAELTPQGELCLQRVIPEGKPEMPFESFYHANVKSST